jgi:U3 small nucleolar RNA-associated protein 10
MLTSLLLKAAINPQTYHQSLLLLAQLGPLVPDQLVHNVIPIFTFMGANVLQRDDAYSLRVVDQTLDSIVPALVKAMQKSASGREGLLAELKDLLRAFTDAAAHVPRHRRINLFVRLVETLGAKEFLSAVSMLLVDKAGKVDESALPLVLFEHFDVDVQLSALKQSVEEVARLVNLEVSFLQVAP